MNFVSGGQVLPGDWVNGAKLLLFIKRGVASRLPKSGNALRRIKGDGKRPQRRKRSSVRGRYSLGAGDGQGEKEGPGEGLLMEGDDDDLQPPIILIYNTVQGCVSAIYELLAHQVSRGLHRAPEPH